MLFQNCHVGLNFHAVLSPNSKIVHDYIVDVVQVIDVLQQFLVKNDKLCGSNLDIRKDQCVANALHSIEGLCWQRLQQSDHFVYLTCKISSAIARDSNLASKRQNAFEHLNPRKVTTRGSRFDCRFWFSSLFGCFL